MSPHHINSINSIIPPSDRRSSSANRQSSASPTDNGTPPPSIQTSVAGILPSSAFAHDSQRLLKIRRFLGALVQFGQDRGADVGERLRSLVLALAVIEIFHVARCVNNGVDCRAAECLSRNFRAQCRRRPIFRSGRTFYLSSDRTCSFCSVT